MRTETTRRACSCAVAALLLCAAACSGPPPPRKDPDARRQWNQKGVRKFRSGDDAAAQEFFLRALEESRNLDDLPSEVESLRNLARLRERQGDARGARERFEAAIEICRLLEDRSGVAACLDDLAAIDIAEGKIDDASKRLGEALRIQEEIEDGRGKAVTLNQTGLLRLREGREREARDLFAKAEELNRDKGARPDDLAANLANRARAEEALGALGKATKALEEALDLNRKREDRHGIALSLCALARVAEKSGDLRGALRYYRRALRVNEGIGAEDRAKADRREITRLCGALGLAADSSPGEGDPASGSSATGR